MKRFLFISLFLMSFFLVSCKSNQELDITKEKDFRDGEIVEYQGVIYEYFDASTITNSQTDAIEYKFQEELNHKAYYDYYYYDMTGEYHQKEMYPISLRNGPSIKDSMISEYPTSAYYFRVSQFFSGAPNGIISNGFIIKGYNEKLPKNVIIPELICGHNISQIGYKAFANSSMETFKFEGEHVVCLVHPNAFSNCVNLKNISITEAYYLSMSINHCENLEMVGGKFNPVGDCVCYNLPNLTSFYAVNFESFRHWSSFKYYTGLGGLRKSYFYQCPSLVEFSSCSNGSMDYYVENDVVYTPLGVPIYVFNNYKVKLNPIGFIEDQQTLVTRVFYTVLYNAETKKAYLPFLNDGLKKSGTISIPENSQVFMEETDGIYANVTYSNKEYNAKVLLQKK